MRFDKKSGIAVGQSVPPLWRRSAYRRRSSDRAFKADCFADDGAVGDLPMLGDCETVPVNVERFRALVPDSLRLRRLYRRLGTLDTGPWSAAAQAILVGPAEAGDVDKYSLARCLNSL